MKWKIALLFAIVLGAVGGSWIKNLPGFIIIAVDKTSYEMRLWVAVAILILFLSILFLLGLFIRSLLSSATKVKGWQGGRQWKKARKQTIEGMMAFVEGRWSQSESTMINAAKNSDTKLINYLIAAQSAQHQNAEDRRDQYLRLADKAEPNAKIAIGLTQARLQLENQQFEQALATLNNLSGQNKNHPFILKLLHLTYQELQDWNAILNILPQLRKFKVFDIESIDSIESECISGMLEQNSKNNEPEALVDTWSKLPTTSRKKSLNIINYCQKLVQLNQMDEAEKLLRPLFKKTPSDALIVLYGETSASEQSKQFTFLENWYNHTKNAPNEIYLALGRIAYNSSLWGKARFYLERSLRNSPSAESYFVMAKTLNKMEDAELADECYRQGLAFVIDPASSINQSLLTNQHKESQKTNLIAKL